MYLTLPYPTTTFGSPNINIINFKNDEIFLNIFFQIKKKLMKESIQSSKIEKKSFKHVSKLPRYYYSSGF